MSTTTNVYDLVAQSFDAKIAAIRHGIPSSQVSVVKDDLGISQKDILNFLRINERTGTRALKEDRLLDQSSSERLLRLVEAQNLATDVFENKETGISWLTTKNSVLGDKPIELLDTDIGYEQVKRVLTSIAWGLPV